jgi:uncharacterized protein (TIGR02466 family)
MRGSIQMNSNKHLNEHLIFQTPIWGFILNSEQYHAFDYIELLEELKKNEPSVRKSNFGGYQTRDNLQREGVMREFVNLVTTIANDIGKHYNAPKLKMVSMWGNINYNRDFNGAHTHEGILSGVFYLEVPDNSGSLIFCNPAVRSYDSVFRNKDYMVKPEKFACIFFPSWLEHYVEPSRSENRRISLSFNFGVDYE